MYEKTIVIHVADTISVMHNDVDFCNGCRYFADSGRILAAGVRV